MHLSRTEKQQIRALVAAQRLRDLGVSSESELTDRQRSALRGRQRGAVSDACRKENREPTPCHWRDACADVDDHSASNDAPDLDLRIDLRRAVEKLPDNWRAAYVMTAEGYTTEEIATSLAAPRSTVAYWLRNARTSLTKELTR